MQTYLLIILLYLIDMFTGYLNSFIQLLTDFCIKKVSPQAYQQLHNPGAEKILTKLQVNWQQQPNNLISNANQMSGSTFDFTVKHGGI